MSETSPMDSLIADFRVSMKRLKESPLSSAEDVSRELQLNVYPSLIALAEQIAEVDEVVLELSEQGDSYLQPELAKQIFQTIALGAAVIDETRKILPLVDDDLARKRIKDLLDGFAHSMELTVMGVNDAVVDDDGDDGDDGDKDEDEDENEDEVDTEPGKKKVITEGEEK
jgi:hypothetical protein